MDTQYKPCQACKEHTIYAGPQDVSPMAFKKRMRLMVRRAREIDPQARVKITFATDVKHNKPCCTIAIG